MGTDRTKIDSAEDLGDLIRAAREEMPESARARVRERLLGAVGNTDALGRARLVFVRSAAAFTATATLLAGTGLAAAVSMPGDLLYPLKRAAEELHLTFTPDARQGEALLDLTRNRVEEVRRLMESEAPTDDVERAAKQFEKTAGRLVESMDDGASREAYVDEIEEVVAEEPAPVQQRIQSGVPAPTPEPSPSPGGSAADPSPTPSPDPDPSRTKEGGSGSGGDGSGGAPSGPGVSGQGR